MIKTFPFNAALLQKLPGLNRNLFSSPSWLSVLNQTYNIRLFVKYIECDGKVSSWVIYSVVHNFLEDKICVCSYCDYFDCYIEKPEDWQLFFDSLRAEYPMYRIAVRNLRDDVVRQNSNFSILSQERFHYIDLKPDLDSLWKNMHDTFRRGIKKAEKGGIVVRAGGKSDYKIFYALHLKLRKNKYRLFPQPYRFFECIWDEYIEKNQGVLLAAYDKTGRMIAGTVYLMCGNTLYYKFNTSDLNSIELRPNNLLVWEGIKLAKEKGLEVFDFGSSGYDQEGLITFKSHVGAKMLDITHLGFNPPDYKFSQKRILKLMTNLFTSPWMPDSALRWGSSLIYPYLA